MLAEKSTFVSMARCLAFVVLFLFNVESSGAQTPPTPVEKSTQEIAAPVGVGAAATNTEVAPVKKADETVAPEPALKKTDELPATEAKPAVAQPQATPQCTAANTVRASIVALAQPIFLNRLGTVIPGGMVFALEGDAVGAQLRADKRPRPIVLRANVGDCIEIKLTNKIPAANFKITTTTPNPQTSEVSLHVQGMEWVNGPQDDGAFVGRNNSSLATPSPPQNPPPAGTTWPPNQQTYTLYAKAEGTFLMYSMGDTSSIGSHITNGLFGALNVQPKGAEWYRSQVSQAELKAATTGTTSDQHPIINFNAVYPAGSTYPDGTPIPANTPVLRMTKALPDGSRQIVHTDLTAIITGPNAGRFTDPETDCAAGAPVSPTNDPLFCKNPASPDRRQPYREITVIYHGALGGSLDGTPGAATQAFPVLQSTDPAVLATTIAGQDAFAINYGTGGIGAEIYANRIGVGPMANCVDCKYEEFFLSAWSVGDPAMIVDRPANVNIQNQPPPLATTPAKPALTPAANLCTTAQFGDGAAPNPNCANPHQPAAPATPYKIVPLPKATRVYYPDDPSNVYHSYINDHVKFRILHGGRDVSHVHHQHAHQWLQSPNSDQSSYLDSQMISPGASYTLEMVYNGSGNRNKVVGDSIFHCHFYPHFAAGMWAMWRTHDTFEIGSELQNGIPVKGTRALPDGEIDAGSPTPAIVPMPTLAMAPMPSAVFIDKGQIVYGTPGPATEDRTGDKVTINPGFPFFIPGHAGARPPHPPLDFAPDGQGGFMDGGLPRHVVIGGTVAYESHDTKDWSKDVATMNAIKLSETGTNVELVAMKFFGQRCYASFKPDGSPGSCPSSNSTSPQSTLNSPPTGFILNGLPRKNPSGNAAEQLGATPGAPFADPAVDDNGNAVGTLRRYQAAAIQANVTFNKKKLGWHFPQQRMLALWKDASPTIEYTTTGGSSGRMPEPLFFRGNTGDIIEYWHTNLVPNYYAVDDFQVRTPTDILGQHIHLVKFDVTSSDGAGNGYNYEDGTFSPGEVQEIIRAINHSPTKGFVNFPNQPLLDPSDPQYKVKYAPPKDIFDCTANPNAIRCQPCPELTSATSRPICMSWLGAQTTIQRWYIDPLVDNANVDRTMRTVFTHDHFGPSTHQQAGLYAGLLIEPQGSTWTGNDGTPFGGRSDGGPTSWQARIITTNPADSYREFMLEFQDLQLAYRSTSKTSPSDNPKVGWIDTPNAINPPPGPSLITTGVNALPAGTQSVNYTNEPIAARLGGASAFPPPDRRSDLSYMFDNSVVKQINAIPGNIPMPEDPMTPLMRAYQGDNVQIRMLVGAHVFQHQFNMQGPVWFSEPSWKNSGYRSAQPTGLSEHFELAFKVPSSSAPSVNRACPDGAANVNCVDYLYSPSFDESGITNGLWGIFRAYDPDAQNNDPILTRVVPLPNNPIAPGNNTTYATCPANAPQRTINVTAVTAQQALPNGRILFNGRGDPSKVLQNNLGIMYVRSEDLTPQGKLEPGVPVEPIILRANAGDCITVNLKNSIPANSAVLNTNFTLPQPFTGTVNPHIASSYVGLHPQLLAYDGAKSSGLNVGWNREGAASSADQTVGFNKTITYQWYAGKVDRAADGTLTYTPIEFGALNLFPSDVMFQNPNGLFGAMIIEPQGSTWTCGAPNSTLSCDPSNNPPPTRAQANITVGNSTFREFSLMIGDSVRINGNSTGAVNYRSEPWSFRYQNNITPDFSCMSSNQLASATSTPPTTPSGDPQTPILTANVGQPVRFRMTHPFGTGTSQVFSLHGHVWQRNPYINNGTQLGNNILSQWIGSRDNHGSSDHFDMLIDKAGGEFGRAGDYLYSVFVPTQARDGAWGVFRVGTVPQPTEKNAACPAKSQPGYQPPIKLKDGTERFTRLPLPIMRPN